MHSVFMCSNQLSYTRIIQTYSGGGFRTRDCIEPGRRSDIAVLRHLYNEL